jgi:hypothetical protein
MLKWRKINMKMIDKLDINVGALGERNGKYTWVPLHKQHAKIKL